jgi:glycosyltransferase involved in cell wall biosynthesis
VTIKKTFEPTVSIVVPVFNAEATVKDLLDSLYNVDYDINKLEIIIVDGGSTDKTRDIIERYPVNLFIQEKKGLNVARNIGIQNSSGEVILFTDSDCVVPKNWVKKVIKNFDSNEIGCVGGSVSRYKDAFLSKYADDSLLPVLRKFKNREILNNVKPPLNYPAGCNMAFRRSALKVTKGFDESILFPFEEDELVERVCLAGYKMVLDPDVKIKHKHRNSLKGLLKQTFSYGKGGAKLFRRKKSGDKLAFWNFLTLLFFSIWAISVISSSFLALSVDSIFLFPLFLITVIPFGLLILFYFLKAVRERDSSKILYPFIDLIRFFTYIAGEIYGFFI